MKLEDQVVSLELAKRLKELGVKQESLFYHLRSTVDGEWHIDNGNVGDEECFAAFTVAELGEILGDCGRYLPSKRKGEPWFFFSDKGRAFDAETEADARAKMLIHLIEKGLVKP